MLDHTKPYTEKMHYIDAELAGYAHKLDMKLLRLCGSSFSLFAVRIGQHHFAKTKMGYISLPWNLNAMIGMTSYYCVILQVVILHDAIKTIPNGVLFLKKNKNLFLFKKNKTTGIKKSKKTRRVVFFKKTGFSQPWLSFNLFLKFSFDRTIWNKPCHYQFD